MPCDDESLYSILTPKNSKKNSLKTVKKTKWHDAEDLSEMSSVSKPKIKNSPNNETSDEIIFLGTDVKPKPNALQNNPQSKKFKLEDRPILRAKTNTNAPPNVITKKLDDIFFQRHHDADVPPRPPRRQPRRNIRLPNNYNEQINLNELDSDDEDYDEDFDDFLITGDIFNVMRFAQQIPMNVFQRRQVIPANLQNLLIPNPDNIPNQTTKNAPVTQSRFQQLPSWKFYSAAVRSPSNPAQNDSTDSSTCSICLDDLKINDQMKTLPCMHYYHEKCIWDWLKNNGVCPTCRCSIGR